MSILSVPPTAATEKCTVIFPRLTLESAGINRFQAMPRITITVPDKTPQPYRFQLDRESVTLGRGSDNDIAIDSGSVSVSHAEMRRVVGGYELRDTGSTNGIKLDDERMEVIPLHNGMSVKLGDVDFDFQLTDEEIEALSHENVPEAPPATPDPGYPSFPPLPGKLPITSPVMLPPAHHDDEGMGLGGILWFFLLALLAFFAGMAMRHKHDTGNYLLRAILDKPPPKESPAKP